VTLQADLLVLLPELILAVGALGLLLLGAIFAVGDSSHPAGFEKPLPAISWAAVLLLAGAGVATVMGPGHATAFHGAFVADGFSRFAKILILFGAALSILLADEFFVSIQFSRFELPVLMLLATLGMLLMVSSASFSLRIGGLQP
jgi:NADH-quinone oxidoreductase subunit N